MLSFSYFRFFFLLFSTFHFYFSSWFYYFLIPWLSLIWAQTPHWSLHIVGFDLWVSHHHLHRPPILVCTKVNDPNPETEVHSCKSILPELYKWRHQTECCTCQSRVAPPLQEGCWRAEPGLGDVQPCLMCFWLCLHRQRWTLSILFHHGSSPLQMSPMTVTEVLLRLQHSSTFRQRSGYHKPEMFPHLILQEFIIAEQQKRQFSCLLFHFVSKFFLPNIPGYFESAGLTD